MLPDLAKIIRIRIPNLARITFMLNLVVVVVFLFNNVPLVTKLPRDFAALLYSKVHAVLKC